MKYYLRGCWEKDCKEVSKEQYIQAERAAGFYPKSGGKNDIATAGFSNGTITGRVEYEKGD